MKTFTEIVAENNRQSDIRDDWAGLNDLGTNIKELINDENAFIRRIGVRVNEVGSQHYLDAKLYLDSTVKVEEEYLVLLVNVESYYLVDGYDIYDFLKDPKESDKIRFRYKDEVLERYKKFVDNFSDLDMTEVGEFEKEFTPKCSKILTKRYNIKLKSPMASFIKSYRYMHRGKINGKNYGL